MVGSFASERKTERFPPANSNATAANPLTDLESNKVKGGEASDSTLKVCSLCEYL